nr:hypothetical protein [Tanacetum cinerariifolium]
MEGNRSLQFLFPGYGSGLLECNKVFVIDKGSLFYNTLSTRSIFWFVLPCKLQDDSIMNKVDDSRKL